MNIVISDAFEGQIAVEILEQAARAALQAAGRDGDLSVVVDDDARLQQLNRDYLEIDAPTDVLSFPSGEDQPDPETDQVYLGDVIISYPRASEQANAAGHEVVDELQLLVVHGVLHLLGYDHAEEDEKSRMWATQSEILQSLDVRLNRLPE